MKITMTNETLETYMAAQLRKYMPYIRANGGIVRDNLGYERKVQLVAITAGAADLAICRDDDGDMMLYPLKSDADDRRTAKIRHSSVGMFYRDLDDIESNVQKYNDLCALSEDWNDLIVGYEMIEELEHKA